MGIILQLEESDFAGFIDDGQPYGAQVVGVRLREKPYKDDAGNAVKKIEFHFKLVSDDGHDGQDIWGETSTKFNTHPSCVVPGTEVLPLGHVLGASKAPYEGPVVDLVVGSGERLAVTVNHPVLTARGWVAAGDLGEGDQVVRHGCLNRAVAREQLDHVPARVEDVFEALAVVAPHSRVAATASDFHDDGQFMDGDVEVVLAEGELRYRLEASGAQNSKKSLLVPGLWRTPPRLGFGSSGSVGEGQLPAGVGRVSGSDGWGVVAAVATRDPLFLKTVEDRGATAADLAADIRESGASTVTLDDVVDVQFNPHRGHVYNLNTTSNAYFANGLLVHNCRLKAWSEAVLGMVLPPRFELDTDMLVDRRCIVIVGKKEWTKDGETKTRNFVREVHPTKENAKALAASMEEPF
jgi:hypothetical protein